MTRLAPRPSLLRTILCVVAGIATLLVGLGLAVRPGVSPAAQLALGICGFAGYIALVGPALDRRYRLDRKWRQDPPDLDSFKGRKSPGGPRGREGSDSPGMLLAAASLAAGLTLAGNVATAAEVPRAATDAEELSFATPAGTPESPETAESAKSGLGLLDGIRLSGFVDVYVAYNANRPASRDNFLPGTGSTAKKANELGLNLVAVEAVKDPAPLGFRVVLNWGNGTEVVHAGEPTGNAIGPEVWKVVQYASISWKVPGSEVLLEGGIFPCHVGAEAYFSKDNAHYTRSFVAEYTPWYQAGVKVSAPLGTGFTGQIHVLNGWQMVGDNNNGKTIGAGLGWTSAAIDIGLNGLGGPELPDDTAHWRTLGDLVVTWRAMPSLTLTGELDAGSQSRPGLDAATWWGAFVSARATLTETSAIAVRAERFSDPHAGITGFSQKLWGVTGTLEHRPHPRLILKLEARYDRSTAPLFDGPVAGEGKESQLIGVLGAVATF